MKCCGCSKELNINAPLKDGEPQIFRKFRLEDCTKVICPDCIKIPAKKETYMKG